jgi:16S rRNA (cytidine1402-2'-O)-methyltransferase
MPGTLIVCATPIGNLGDVSSRLAEALGRSDVIYAEDTRRTGVLLSHLGVTTPMRSFFTGNERSRLDEMRSDLQEGRTVALVSDAGTPVISDPGASAVALAVASGATVTAIPGPSAVTLAIAMSGFDGDRFVFDGFLPRKGRERGAALSAIASEMRTVVLFASPHRVADDLVDLASACGGDRRVVVARELTKLHEEAWHGSLAEAAAEFAGPDRRRGEFTLVVEGAPAAEASIDDAVDLARGLIADGASTSDAVREAAGAVGVSRREVYDRILRSGPG